MQLYEYKVIPAPRRGEKARGAKSVADRFGVALAHAMNDLARDGWEYVRSDTLPCDERVGLTGTATHFHHMLVFRRALAAAAPAASAPAQAVPPPPVAHPPVAELPPPPATAQEATVIAPLRALPGEGAAPSLGPAPVDDFRSGAKR